VTVSELIEELKKMPLDEEVTAFWGEPEDQEFKVSEVSESSYGPVIFLDPK